MRGFLYNFIELKVTYQPSDGADIGQTELGRDLIEAARSGDADLVTRLLEQGAGVMAKDPLDRTALHHAAMEGHVRVVELLIRAGADVNAEAYGEETALHLAAHYGYKDVVALLLDNGAEKDARDIDGRTAIYFSVLGGHRDVVELLLNNRARVNIEPRYGAPTLVHCAAFHGHRSIVELLIEKTNTYLGILDANGRTAMDVARTDEIRTLLNRAKIRKDMKYVLYLAAGVAVGTLSFAALGVAVVFVFHLAGLPIPVLGNYMMVASLSFAGGVLGLFKGERWAPQGSAPRNLRSD